MCEPYETDWAKLAELAGEHAAPPRGRQSRNWAKQCGAALAAGLEIRETPAAVTVHLYGAELPDTAIHRRSDGTLHAPGRSDPGAGEPPEDWAPRLPLPKPGQPVQRFMNRWSHYDAWDMGTPLERLLQSRLPHDWPGLHLVVRNGRSIFLEHRRQWAAAVSRLTAQEPLKQLLKLAGNAIRCDLRHHNLAIHSLPVLRELARTNPGAVGWWLGNYGKYDDALERKCHFTNVRHNPLYRGTEPPFARTRVSAPEIIAQARAQFREAGGRYWKTLAAQPAGDVAGLLAANPPGMVARFSDLLHEAQLNHPSGRKRPQPSRTIKKQAIRQLNPQYSERQHAIRLLLRAAAGRPQHEISPTGGHSIIGSLFNVMDYAQSEPEAARRAATWNGLLKAGDQWHHRMVQEKQVIAARSELRRAGINMNAVWTGPLNEAELPDGGRARLLASPHELLAETLSMKHCVGLSADYARRCQQGEGRIFHLEHGPDGADPQTDTTVELTADAAAGPEWRIRQHRGRSNRPPTAAEQQAAVALLARCNQIRRGTT